MLHTMYGQALRHSAEFFIEYFAIDLIMDDEGRCRGVVALSMQDGTLHRFRAHQTILATGGYGRAYFSCASAHICTGDGNAMVLRAGLPLAGHGVRAVPPDPASMRRRADHRRRARRRRLPAQFQGREVHGALRAMAKEDLASRDLVSRAITIEIREGRGVGPDKEYIHLHLDHLPHDILHERLP